MFHRSLFFQCSPKFLIFPWEKWGGGGSRKRTGCFPSFFLSFSPPSRLKPWENLGLHQLCRLLAPWEAAVRRGKKTLFCPMSCTKGEGRRDDFKSRRKCLSFPPSTIKGKQTRMAQWVLSSIKDRNWRENMGMRARWVVAIPRSGAMMERKVSGNSDFHHCQ